MGRKVLAIGILRPARMHMLEVHRVSKQAPAECLVRFRDVARCRTHCLQPVSSVLIRKDVCDVPSEQVAGRLVVVDRMAPAVAGRMREGQVMHAKLGQVPLWSLQYQRPVWRHLRMQDVCQCPKVNSSLLCRAQAICQSALGPGPSVPVNALAAPPPDTLHAVHIRYTHKVCLYLQASGATLPFYGNFLTADHQRKGSLQIWAIPDGCHLVGTMQFERARTSLLI